MAALMYDSDNETYPDGCEYIAAYVDGSRTGRNLARARAARPDAKVLTISAVGEVDADVIDIEPGNVWPPENAVPWIRRQLARGHVPMYYCNTSTRQQCIDVFRDAGLPELPWWRADYREAFRHSPPTDLPLGEHAWQYANPPITGSHWDVSVIGPEVKAYLDGHSDAIAGEAQDSTPINPEADLTGGLTEQERDPDMPFIVQPADDTQVGAQYLIHLDSQGAIIHHIDGDHSESLIKAYGQPRTDWSAADVARIREECASLGLPIKGDL